MTNSFDAPIHAAIRRKRRLRRMATGSACALVLITGAAVSAHTVSAAEMCAEGVLPFDADLSNGLITIGPLAKLGNGSGHACGAVAQGAGSDLTATVPQSQLRLDDGTISVILPIPMQLAAMSDFTGPVTVDATGAYHLTLTGTIQAKVNILGAPCQTPPFNISLTTDTTPSGRPKYVAGEALARNEADGLYYGKLASNTFIVPAMQPGNGCNVFAQLLATLFVGLPNQSGAATAIYDVTATIG
jgi:hypothetical protein